MNSVSVFSDLYSKIQPDLPLLFNILWHILKQPASKIPSNSKNVYNIQGEGKVNKKERPGRIQYLKSLWLYRNLKFTKREQIL